jgi:O-antigen ligase
MGSTPMRHGRFDLPSAVTAASGSLRRARAGIAPATFLLIALAVGVVVGRNPLVGVGLAMAIVFVLVVIWDLALGLCAFLLLAFLDVVSRNTDLSLTKAAGALLAAAWVATMATRRESKRSFLSAQPWLTVVLVVFLAWSGLSAIWAEDPAAASRSTVRFALNAMLVPIVFWAVRDRRHVLWVVVVFIVGAQLSVLWGMSHHQVIVGRPGQVGRLSGATVEANALATLLIVCTVFAGGLVLALRRAPLARALAAAAALAAIAAFFATFSRGGIVALAAVILAGIVYGGRWRSAFVTLALVVALVGFVYVNEATSGAAGRLSSGNSSGRVDIWRVGLRMVKANPVRGVGSGNFTIAEPHYLLAPGSIGRPELILDTPLVAHNIYLHVLAEMGIVGLTLFLAVLALSIGSAIRAVSIFRLRRERSLEVLGRALVIALAGVLAADFFVSEQYSKQLWVLLAMGPALLAIARRAPDRVEVAAASSRGRIDP